jgi:hypothetical protein
MIMDNAGTTENVIPSRLSALDKNIADLTQVADSLVERLHRVVADTEAKTMKEVSPTGDVAIECELARELNGYAGRIATTTRCLRATLNRLQI